MTEIKQFESDFHNYCNYSALVIKKFEDLEYVKICQYQVQLPSHPSVKAPK